MVFSKEWNMNPFEVLQQDVDDFILLAKYLLSLGAKRETEEQKAVNKNDGFWDF